MTAKPAPTTPRGLIPQQRAALLVVRQVADRIGAAVVGIRIWRRQLCRPQPRRQALLRMLPRQLAQLLLLLLLALAGPVPRRTGRRLRWWWEEEEARRAAAGSPAQGAEVAAAETKLVSHGLVMAVRRW